MDAKGLGYLISSISVLILGLIAWPGPNDPAWQAPGVLAGMALSILGMGVRFMSHRQDRRDIRRAARDQAPES